MGKGKKIKVEKDAEEEMDIGNESLNVTAEEKVLSYEEKVKYISVIAKPLASRKMAKKIYKLIKKELPEFGLGLCDILTELRWRACKKTELYENLANVAKWLDKSFNKTSWYLRRAVNSITSKQKMYLRHGLRDVQSGIRKGETGIVIFAGDVTPIEIMCHMPAVCEENNIPYVYTPSRQDLGMAMGVKRSVLMVLIKKHEDYEELYDECYNAINAIPLPI